MTEKLICGAIVAILAASTAGAWRTAKRDVIKIAPIIDGRPGPEHTWQERVLFNQGMSL